MREKVKGKRTIVQSPDFNGHCTTVSFGVRGSTRAANHAVLCPDRRDGDTNFLGRQNVGQSHFMAVPGYDSRMRSVLTGSGQG